MNLFTKMVERDYEQLVVCQDRTSGLKAIIAIHDTTLGPALGGTRMWNYETEEEAFEDVLRLSRGMTYKNAAAGLNLGGGKAVIIGDARKDKNPEMFRAFGRYIQGLNGRYITAEDVVQQLKIWIQFMMKRIMSLEFLQLLEHLGIHHRLRRTVFM